MVMNAYQKRGEHTYYKMLRHLLNSSQKTVTTILVNENVAALVAARYKMI